MKKSLFVVLCLCFCAVFKAQTAPNFPLPQNPDTLRILAIGNSFSEDGTTYLPQLLQAAGINNVILGHLTLGGCSLERHCVLYEKGEAIYTYYKSVNNAWKTVKDKNASFLDGICDEPWDIISIQQVSNFSGVWDSFNPWLSKNIEMIRKHCSNPKATIVWHKTWAYSRKSTHKAFPTYEKDQEKMYNMINQCVDKLQQAEDISVIIPSGTTIQMLRSTRLCGDNDLTRDGFHLDRQCGRYAAACTWFEALIKPTLGISVKKAKTCLEGTEHELSAKDAKLCRKTAIKAVESL